MSSPEIQIAFQGGGAKFIAMLPVADAFRTCVATRRIRVKAVAGTSAGAICAALLAAECDFSTLRTYLLTAGSGHVSKLAGTNVAHLKALASTTGLQRFKALYSAAPLLKSVIFDGDPLLNEAEFGIFLDRILRFCTHAATPIERLPTRLSIVVTDMAKSSGEVICTGSIKNALRDSCALPLAFRSFRHLSISHRVDGGLSDNLPVECLADDGRAPIFAVFPEEDSDRQPVDNIFLYMLSMLSASIDNSVRRSKAMVSDAFQIPVRTSFSTFGFSEALELLADDDWYERVKSETIDLITDFAHNYGRIDRATDYRVDDTRNIDDYVESMKRMSGDYSEHAEVKLSRLTVRVNCADVVADGTQIDKRPADSVTKLCRLLVKDNKLRYFRFSLHFEGNRPVPSIWRAHNRSRKLDIPIKVLSLSSPTDNGNNRTCLVEFLDPELHFVAGEEIEVSDTLSRRDAMTKMNNLREEFVSLANPHPYPTETAEIVLMYPPSLGRYVMENDEEIGDVLRSSVKEAKLQDAGTTDLTVIGLACSDLGTTKKFYCRIIPRA